MSYNINPYIETTLAGTVAEVQQAIVLLRTMLQPSSPDDIILGYDERSSLNSMLYGLQKACGHVMEHVQEPLPSKKEAL